MFNPRPKQQEVLTYNGGWMGVAAVPGAGKTRTLSALAAKILTEMPLEPGQEVLIVTLVNAAVGNFSRQIREFMKTEGLIAGPAVRVRTLHGLANDIVRERPELVGLSDNFAIVDEREANEILRSAADAWLRGNPTALDDFIDEEYQDRTRLRERDLPDTVANIAGNFIRQAKDAMWMPEDVFRALDETPEPLPLAAMSAEIFQRYQIALNYRGGVDFQDLIRLALKALQEDPGYGARLRNRWRYILEDEAQDSDRLQEQILRTLAGDGGNWVRVGDPNQAIYETFTTANPHYLREFIASPGVQARELPNSGRSQVGIIRLANWLIDWSLNHENPQIRSKQPLSRPYIEPTPPNDPQPNPPEDLAAVHLHSEGFAPAAEIDNIIRSVKAWLAENPDMTAAILTPRNQRGFEVAQKLADAGVPYVEMLRSTASTRQVAGSVYHVLSYLAEPTSPDKLARLYRVFRRDDKANPEVADEIKQVAHTLQTCTQVETYIQPRGEDWLDVINADPDMRGHLDEFRERVRRLQSAASLPIDQLVLTIAGEIFHEENDLAVAYSISLRLRRDELVNEQSRQGGAQTSAWGLKEYAARLAEIARNERKFLGMSEDETAFNPDKHKGKVTVATMHGAKGLEWDRVYLMSVNSYNFPMAEFGDSFIGEKWFARDKLNLDAEARAQLMTLINGEPYLEGQATQDARIEYAAERLRLLYVGITRARQDLIMTWNNGRRGDQREAAPMIAMRTFWEGVRS